MKRSLPSFLFDTSTDQGKRNFERMLQAFYDMILMVNVVDATFDSSPGSILDNYFRASEDAIAVQKMLKGVIGCGTDPPGSELFPKITVTDRDFGSACNDPLVLAYEDDVEADRSPKRGAIHFCDRAYDQKLIEEIECDELGDTVSGKMSTMGALLFHEVT
jgi:hypothetical protein